MAASSAPACPESERYCTEKVHPESIRSTSGLTRLSIAHCCVMLQFSLPRSGARAGSLSTGRGAWKLFQPLVQRLRARAEEAWELIQPLMDRPVVLQLAGIPARKRRREGEGRVICLVPGSGSPVPIPQSEFLRHSELADLEAVTEFPVHDFDQATAQALEGALVRGCLSTEVALKVMDLAQVLGMQTLVRTVLITWKLAPESWERMHLWKVPTKYAEQLRGAQLSAASVACVAASWRSGS